MVTAVRAEGLPLSHTYDGMLQKCRVCVQTESPRSIRYLPPTLHPAVSRELSSLSSPSCSPDPGSSLGDGKGSFPACGPDAMWYAFLFFQRVVKLITLGNDFLTVLGKEKEGGKKRPLKKNEPWR